MTPDQASTRNNRKALLGVICFPALGGGAAALVEQNLLIGATAYYALLALALFSPQGAALRHAAMVPRRPIAADPNGGSAGGDGL